MTFPNAPSPLSYGPPLLDFSALGDLGNQYYKGAEDKRKYDVSRTFKDGVPLLPNGEPDLAAALQMVGRAGGAQEVERLIPGAVKQSDRQGLQNDPGIGRQSNEARMVPPMREGPSRPQLPVSPSDQPSPFVPKQPPLSSAGADNEGAQNLRALGTELSGGRDVADIIDRYAQGYKIKPDDPLTPEMEAQIKPLLAKSIAARAAMGRGPQQPPQSAAAANDPIAQILPPGFKDPKLAIDAYRTAAERVLRASPENGQVTAKLYLDRADAIEKAAFGAPLEFERTADRGLRPIPGGPADTAYISAKTDAALRPMLAPPGSEIIDPKTGKPIHQNNSGLLDHPTIDAMARQAMSGDTSVFTNLGRGAQGAENVIAVRKRIAELNSSSGETGSEQAVRNAEFFGVKAGQRTLGTRSANIELAATEFKQVLPVVQAASKAVSRTNYPDLNRIIQAFEEKTGDPNIVKFGGGVNTLVNLYARAISPSGTPTVSDKDHARLILNRAWSQGQFDAAVGMMSQEIDAALSSPDKVRDAMRERFLGGQAKPAAGAERPTREQPGAASPGSSSLPPLPPGFERNN